MKFQTIRNWVMTSLFVLAPLSGQAAGAAPGALGKVSCVCQAEYRNGPPYPSAYVLSVIVDGTLKRSERFASYGECEQFRAHDYVCSGREPVGRMF